MKELVEEIAIRTQGQADAIQQISGSVAEIQQVTQQAEASTQESTVAVEQLNHQSMVLRDVVGRLQQILG